HAGVPLGARDRDGAAGARRLDGLAALPGLRTTRTFRTSISTRFASSFFEEANVTYHHALVDRLDHVIDRQGGNGDGCQRFHLDTRLGAGPHPGLDAIASPRRRQLDADVRERQ